MAKNKRKKYYAVAKGHKTGVYNSWEDCKEQVSGYSKNQYKGFRTKSEAEDYIQKHSDSNNTSQSLHDSTSPAPHATASPADESSRKRRRLDEGTNDQKQRNATPTNSSSKASSQYKYDYDQAYYASLDALDDDDPVRDYYHSCGFYEYS